MNAAAKQAKPAQGDCYGASLRLLLSGRLPAGSVLVHGRPVLGVPPGGRYGHAWLELAGGSVVFALDSTGAFRAVPRHEFYAAGKIYQHECYRYTAADARAWAIGLRHYGPWEGPHGSPPYNPPICAYCDEDADAGEHGPQGCS